MTCPMYFRRLSRSVSYAAMLVTASFTIPLLLVFLYLLFVSPAQLFGSADPFLAISIIPLIVYINSCFFYAVIMGVVVAPFMRVLRVIHFDRAPVAAAMGSAASAGLLFVLKLIIPKSEQMFMHLFSDWSDPHLWILLLLVISGALGSLKLHDLSHTNDA